MKLPSGYEISKEKLIGLCKDIITEKLIMECTYDEAFEPTAEALAEGRYSDIPELNQDDIPFLYNTFISVVIDCEGALRSTLGTFMADSAVVNSW